MRALVFVMLAVLVSNTACEDTGCTEIGCADTVAVSFGPELRQAMVGEYTVAVVVDGAEITATCPGGSAGLRFLTCDEAGLSIEGVNDDWKDAPPSVQVAIEFFTEDAGVRIDEVLQLGSPRFVSPNGEGCSPTCAAYAATVELTDGESDPGGNHCGAIQTSQCDAYCAQRATCGAPACTAEERASCNTGCEDPGVAWLLACAAAGCADIDRCVENPCAGVSCTGGRICDPETRGCVEPEF